MSSLSIIMCATITIAMLVVIFMHFLYNFYEKESLQYSNKISHVLEKQRCAACE